MGSERFNFRLRTVLFGMTVAAVLLGVVTLLPRGLRNLSIAALAMIAGATVLFLLLLGVDRVVVGTRVQRPPAIASIMLTSVSTLVILLVLLPLPGSRGSMQLWVGDAAAMFVFHVRVATVFMLPFSLFICGLIGKVRLDLGAPFRLGWLIAATISYLVAWWLLWTYAFFPLT